MSCEYCLFHQILPSAETFFWRRVFLKCFALNRWFQALLQQKKWLSLNLLNTLSNASKASKVPSYHYELLQVDLKKMVVLSLNV